MHRPRIDGIFDSILAFTISQSILYSRSHLSSCFSSWPESEYFSRSTITTTTDGMMTKIISIPLALRSHNNRIFVHGIQFHVKLRHAPIPILFANVSSYSCAVWLSSPTSMQPKSETLLEEICTERYKHSSEIARMWWVQSN